MAKRKLKKSDRTLHGEQKQRYSLSLSPSIVAYVDKRAAEIGISRSEFFEQLARADQEDPILELEEDGSDA
ncbi:MAG: ribbon-helix-helix protein, CopG family [Symplocastrum torsivum CPER-KK1]|jgi:metal-responsive CopG/Arc/MetJ family transcriptional regulator|uniref:Ribbon-helix-helix protein, CopG family n=1 Tax=Symplocastrum torsivum CPER-KK1 TaxID=450513 RepID=A0A951PQY5_9CYAN|nr:ribbon-helix-helix protein, CopG family [Symplocastrum torsivum CPER-KK1]